MRSFLLLLPILPLLLGCNEPKAWDADPLVQFVLDDYKAHHKKSLPRWEAYKIVLAARTFAPASKVPTVLACGAEESHFFNGMVGDDGLSQGIYQVQWRYHKHVAWEKLNGDITVNTRCAVEHLRWSKWDVQVYNAGDNGKKKGRGKWHKSKVDKTLERIRGSYLR
jgi:hypothetical protein